MDNGPIIMQEMVRITDDDTLETLEEKIHRAEHRTYPKAIRLFVDGRVKVRGRRVRILAKAPAPGEDTDAGDDADSAE